ncbi:MAG: carboxylesterase [Xanthomonadales bacterium]|nr:carboxylesterase [Xanthomonadales bacterium]
MPAVERSTGGPPRLAVVWLHGLGADGHDFEPIVPELVRPHWPGLRFVFPHAPFRPVTINGGMAMRAWYDIAALDLAAGEDEAGIRESVAIAEALIAREGERGIPPARVFLAGFSQGAAIALATLLRRRQPLAGVIALSGYLPLAAASAAEATPESRSIPAFMAHGRLDEVVPEALGRASRDRLRALGYAVSWHDYPMAHQVCAEEIADLGDWLDARIAGAG